MYWVSYTNYIREENTNKYDKRGKVLAKDPKRHNQKNINLIARENLDNFVNELILYLFAKFK